MGGRTSTKTAAGPPLTFLSPVDGEREREQEGKGPEKKLEHLRPAGPNLDKILRGWMGS